MPKRIKEMRFAELVEDIKLVYLNKTLPKGMQFEVAKSNSRYVYLLWNKCLLRVTQKQVKAISKKK